MKEYDIKCYSCGTMRLAPGAKSDYIVCEGCLNYICPVCGGEVLERGYGLAEQMAGGVLDPYFCNKCRWGYHDKDYLK